MKQQKQVEKLLQFAQRKKNQLLGMQPNQELNALIIADENHRRHKEMQMMSGLDQETRHSGKNKLDFQLGLNEEDFKAKELEVSHEAEGPERVVPQMPDFDMKMMPTFKDLPTLAEDRKTDELVRSEPAHFELAGQQWNHDDWWRQMD